jgi:hypothetical protein
MIDPLERGGAMKAERRLPAGVLLALGLAWGSATAFAQVTTATLLGTVSDSQGGVLAGAAVTATNLDTGLVRTVRTDPSGSYTMVNLPLGRYQLKAEAEGFKTKVVTDLNLVVDQKLRRDVSLEVGNIKETVEVAGQATLLQTDQPDINQIVQEKEIKGLPLNGRDFFSLTLLSNGVQDTSNDQGGATTNVTLSVNGMRPESNSVTLDGVQMSSVRESDVDLRPNVDAIEEFKVLTSPTPPSTVTPGAGSSPYRPRGGRTASTAAPTSSCATTRSTRPTTSRTP